VQLLALVLRQSAARERERTTLEADLVCLGHGVAGGNRVRQIRGLTGLTAIGGWSQAGTVPDLKAVHNSSPLLDEPLPSDSPVARSGAGR
jgi:hypothetical protein